MAHFIIGSDEANLLASGGGVVVRVLGEKDKKKHEKVVSDSRESITILRSAAFGGATGPTNFVMKGARVKSGFTPKYLVKHGAAPGSSVVMTPNAFMTESAWLEMAVSRADGIRAMPVIRDHPEWYCFEIMDGFGPHWSNPEVLQIYRDRRILQGKEEGDTSQVCQMYNGEPAKSDKRALRSGVDMLRQAASYSQGVVSQWDLISVGLAAVRSGNQNPQMWIDAAVRVNLHPDHRRPFTVWLEDIKSFLQGGKSFKIEDYSSDIYPLLPSLGQALQKRNMRNQFPLLWCAAQRVRH
jgi:hypothetical protein